MSVTAASIDFLLRPWRVAGSARRVAFYANHMLAVVNITSANNESVPHMDKRMTVSGVRRGEQRRKYDARRREVLPAHGIRLVVLDYSLFACNSRKRLTRADRAADMAVIQKALATEPVAMETAAEVADWNGISSRPQWFDPALGNPVMPEDMVAFYKVFIPFQCKRTRPSSKRLCSSGAAQHDAGRRHRQPKTMVSPAWTRCAGSRLRRDGSGGCPPTMHVEGLMNLPGSKNLDHGLPHSGAHSRPPRRPREPVQARRLAVAGRSRRVVQHWAARHAHDRGYSRHGNFIRGTGLFHHAVAGQPTPSRYHWHWLRWLLIIAALLAFAYWLLPDHAQAETLRCSTSFQGYRTCQGSDGYRSFEWDNNGYHYGDDNRGNKWTTFNGVGGEITINQRHGQ